MPKIVPGLLLLSWLGMLNAQETRSNTEREFAGPVLSREQASPTIHVINAVYAVQKLQERADSNYATHKYREAFAQYRGLAMFNDKFSQYRLSVMYLNGRGVEQDLVRAYAWSYISAETREKNFVNNHVSIRNQLTPEQLRAGKLLADEYHLEYGTFAIASEARRLIRLEKRRCNNTLPDNICNPLTIHETQCGQSGSGALTRSCLVLGSVGIPGISGLAPEDLSTAEKQLESMVDNYNPGFTELDKLEIVDD